MTAVHAAENRKLTVTFAGSGDAFGSGGRYQACIHIQRPDGFPAVLLDCGATSLSALKHLRLDPGAVEAVFVSHLHGDHFGGLPFLILDGQFSRRTAPLTNHLSADMLDHPGPVAFQAAHDGLTFTV